MPTVTLPTDSFNNYADSVRRTTANRSLIDARPAINDAVAVRKTTAVRSTDSLNQYADAVWRTESMNTVFTNWVTEELIGAKNGVNQTFTISHTPNVASMSVFVDGVRLVRVAGTPTAGEAQYGVSGTTVVLGQPPDIGQWCQTRYFWEH